MMHKRVIAPTRTSSLIGCSILHARARPHAWTDAAHGVQRNPIHYSTLAIAPTMVWIMSGVHVLQVHALVVSR